MIKILASAYQIAEKKVLNYDLAKVIDTSNEWIVSRTGIVSRYYSLTENTSDLAYQASLKALEASNINPNDLDYLVVATMTPDKITPSVANIVHKKLDIQSNKIMCFDINVACSGFVYALDIVARLLRKNEKALVIASETVSKILDFTDRNTCFLFGDGAGALIVASDKSKDYYSYTNSISDNDEVLYANGLPLINQDYTKSFLKMSGQAVFKFAVKACCHSINEVLKESNFEINDLDLIICHQANYRIIKNIAKHLDLDLDKFYLNVDKYGNTSAASIPICLGELFEAGKLKSGMKIVMVAFGSGLAMGSILLEI